MDNSPREKGEGIETVSGADDRRRRLVKGSLLAAPVLASLQSRPVLAGACLSNVLSGNLSNANNGNCQLGWSPGAWANPVGAITQADWATALGMSKTDAYGTYDSSCGNANQCNCYTGGATLSDVALGHLDSSDPPLREVLCSANTYNTGGNITFHCVAAMLNALLSQNDPSFNYVLDPGDVEYYSKHPDEVPGKDLKSFFDWTWGSNSSFVYP